MDSITFRFYFSLDFVALRITNKLNSSGNLKVLSASHDKVSNSALALSTENRIMPANLQVNPELKAELSALARQTHRDETELANEALENYIAWEKQALNKIREGLVQAERGEFVAEEEMDAFFEQHSLPLGK
jgi:predicted transcriptional regulator